jgi:hypothetical protein
MTDPERIAEIRARVEKATKGPWVCGDERLPVMTAMGVLPHRHVALLESVREPDFGANAAFIAHARADIPFLLSALESSQARVREWQPIETAPKVRGYGTLIDIWIVDRRSGRGYRVPDAHYAPCDGREAWADNDGKWVTGKRYYDDEGDDCLDPAGTDEQSRVATHWMSLPDPPLTKEKSDG